MDLRQRIADLMPVVRDELTELVALRSVADPRQFPPEECERAAQWVLEKFADLGFSDAHLEETADGSMAVVGSRTCSHAGAPTVLLYAHYDVQPPLDDDAWRTPPFELTEVDGRWYGRGAADCKGNIVMHLAALRALGDSVPVNLKLVVEGSEEQGTGGLEAFVAANADLLRADAILVCDTGNAAVGHPAATVSLRGMVNVVVTVEALASELHSGMFGGAGARCARRAGGDAGHAARRAGQHHGHGAGQHPALVGRAVPARAVPRGRRRARRSLPARGRQRVGHAVGATGGDHPGHRLPAGRRLRRGHRAEGGGAAEPAHPARDVPRGRRARPGRAPARRRAVGRARHGGGRGDRIARSRPTPTGRRTGPWPPRCRRPTGDRWRTSGRAGRSRCATSSRRPTPTPSSS